MLRVRAPRIEEAPAVLGVILARDVADIGRPDYTLQDVLGDWALPECDVEHDVFVAEDEDGTLVGWADVDASGARVSVHPDHEGRGAGTLLRTAAEARLRERGFALRQGIVASNAAAAEHLRAAGYAPIQTYQRLRATLDAVSPPLDAAVRQFDLDAEGDAVHALIEASFSEIAFNVAPSYATWHAEQAASSEPRFRLALDDDEGLAGAILGHRWEDGVGYVALLAVASRARRRGHARALLLALFGEFRAAGLTLAELSVAGTNASAGGLYASAGMTPDFATERWELENP